MDRGREELVERVVSVVSDGHEKSAVVTARSIFFGQSW